MAYERNRHPPDVRRRLAGAADASSDPIGRLDEVLVTLEQMLEDRGVPPDPRHREEGEASPGRVETPVEQESLPLLQDVVAPVPGPGSEGGAVRPPPDAVTANAPAEREPLPLGFEIVPEETLPGVADVELDPAALDPEGERYGNAPPPSLDPQIYRHLIDRLANEIDVIVQTGTEEAMRRAAVDITARVREHVAIILPEVIEELVRMSNRPSD